MLPSPKAVVESSWAGEATFSCPVLSGALQMQNIKQLQGRIQLVLPLWVLDSILAEKEGGGAGCGF